MIRISVAGSYVDAVQALEVRRQRPPELDGAEVRRVVGPALAQALDARLDDLARRVEVGLPHPEADDVVHRREDVEEAADARRRHGADALGERSLGERGAGGLEVGHRGPKGTRSARRGGQIALATDQGAGLPHRDRWRARWRGRDPPAREDRHDVGRCAFIVKRRPEASRLPAIGVGPWRTARAPAQSRARPRDQRASSPATRPARPADRPRIAALARRCPASGAGSSGTRRSRASARTRASPRVVAP